MPVTLTMHDSVNKYYSTKERIKEEERIRMEEERIRMEEEEKLKEQEMIRLKVNALCEFIRVWSTLMFDSHPIEGTRGFKNCMLLVS